MTATAKIKQDKNSDTRQRLLLTALNLYAVEGLHAVSLRRISADAGSKNSAAMHYHFANKQGVITALVELVARELGRIANDLRTETKTERSLRGAFRATLQPLVQLPARQSWGSDGVRFLSRLVSDSDAETAAMVNEFYAPFFQRLDRALAEELPQLPAAVRRLRLMFISTNVLHGVAEASWLSHTPLGDLSQFDEDTLLDHLVDYLIGGLTAPSPAPSQSP